MFIELSSPLVSDIITVNTENILSIIPRFYDPRQKDAKFYLDFIFKKPIRNKEDENAFEHCLVYETVAERDTIYSDLKELMGVISIIPKETY